MVPAVAGTVWKQNTELADKANQPGKFTAFCSYEWTSTPNNMNLHRNVFFKDCAKVPVMPFTSLDSQHQWISGTGWMHSARPATSCSRSRTTRISRTAACTRPRSTRRAVPIDAAYAASRDRNERLIEIKQIKGQSETHPLLSPNDEFAGFEIMSILLGDPAGRIPHIVGSYAGRG
jgi:hypothetical protein